MRHSPFLTAVQDRPDPVPPLGMKLLPAAMLLAFGCALPMHGWTQIRTDGSVGPGAQTLTGPRYQIGENLGRLSGQNLFHSFQSFNLAKGESANFTTSTAGINNVISRVTGGTASQINGQISLTAASGAPNFYFINPAGVTFGAGASIDVPGAFHVSTADYLKFADGKFFADPKAASTFSAATPESFGFLGNNRASVNVMDNAELRPRLEQSVSLVAGDVSVDNALVQTVGGGTIRVAAVGAEAKEIPFSGTLPATSGNLSVLNSGMIRSLAGATAPVLGTVATQEDPAPTPAPDPRGNGNGNGRSGPITPTPDPTPTPTVTTFVIKPGEPRNGGNISVSAGDVILDGKANFNSLTGILSATDKIGANAGNIDVKASRGVTLRDNGVIVGQTFSNGNAADVSVTARSVTVDGTTVAPASAQLYTAIGSGTYPGASGNAGNVTVNTSGDITLRNGGIITSPTFSPGNAGTVKVTATNIEIDGQGNSNDTGITSTAYANSAGNAGSVEVSASGAILIAHNSGIDSSTLASGNAGIVKVSAASISMDGKSQDSIAAISSSAYRGSSGRGGTVEVNVSGPLNLRNGSLIDSSTQSSGNAGSVKVNATSIQIEGGTNRSSISSGTSGSTGSAGNVEVNTAGDLLIIAGGFIHSVTDGPGNAGNIKINAGNLGVAGDATTLGTGGIYSSTGGAGHAGSIEVVSPGVVIIGQNGVVDSSTLKGAGDAGSIKINAHDFYIGAAKGQAMVSSAAGPDSTGQAGSLEINASNMIAVLDNGFIQSLTAGPGNGGTIKINAGKIALTGNAGILTSAAPGASGNAGSIVITSPAALTLTTGAVIDSSTSGNGDAGTINIDIGGKLSIANGGVISSVTKGKGAAGSINVKADSIAIDGKSGILAVADEGSSGQTGTLNIKAVQSLELSNGAGIYISNLATVPEVTTTPSLVSSVQPVSSPIAATTSRQPAPTQINISASDVTVDNGVITADSTGNVSASNININPGRSLTLNFGRISTNANRGNGGSVTVKGGDTITLNRSRVTTSVTGTSGNGGDINIESNGLVLNTGFIRANTAATNGRGGNIGINVDTLLPSMGTLFVGGNTAMAFNSEVPGFNVIQAAAPTGVSGNVKISTPTLNISGTLMALKYQILDTGGLARNPCQVSKGSSLTQSGRGSLPVSASSLLVPAEEGAATTVPLNTSQYGSDLFSRWSCRNG